MITVSAARHHRQQIALSLLFSQYREEERTAHCSELLAADRCGDISLDGLLLAEIDGKPVGALLYILQSDGTAFVWLPSVVADTAVEPVADALFNAARQQMENADALLGQCVVEPDDSAQHEALIRNGFRHLANLSYLRRSLNAALPEKTEIPWEVITFDSATDVNRFAQLLEQTYIETHDCPGMDGVRTGRDALLSHQLSGQFDPSRWKLYRVAERDVGILLLNDHPDQDSWEVVYTGVVPAARGKGYGRAMLIDGLTAARDAGRSGMLLAVDIRNDFAQKIYEKLGFVEVTCRAVYVLPLRQSSEK